jgi:hypothetical protein
MAKFLLLMSGMRRNFKQYLAIVGADTILMSKTARIR